jgi:hypothetical protein
MQQMAGKMKHAMFCGLALAMLVAPAARADIWAYTDPGPGSQTGYPGILLAQSFTVNTAVSVTNIGAFVANGQSLSGDVTVAIVDAQGNVVSGTETLFSAGSYLSAAFHGLDTYKPVSATLVAGSYWLEALGYENPGTPPNYNGNTCPNCGFTGDPPPLTNTDGGALSFSGLSAYTLNASGFGVPAVPDKYANGEPQYQIGTFSVPEPGTTLLLLLFGSIMVGGGLFISRSKSVGKFPHR